MSKENLNSKHDFNVMKNSEVFGDGSPKDHKISATSWALITAIMNKSKLDILN